MEKITKEYVEKYSKWVVKLNSGYRYCGTHEDCVKFIERNKDEVKDFDICAEQPKEVKDFWDSLHKYEDEQKRMIYIDEFIPIYNKMCEQQHAVIKKAISAGIYKHKGEDCSNGGISSKFNDVLILCEDGWIDIDMSNPPENLCKVVKRHLFGSDYYHVEPVQEATEVGWMSGGCVIYSCDSRFSKIGNGYPLVFHDRQESQKLYDLLTND